MTTSAKLSVLARKCRLEVTYGAKLDWDKQSEWQRQANGYSCTLKYKGRRFAFDFWQGIGINGEPDAKSCLDCLLSDANAAGQSFEDWCSDLGYDTDSRTAEATYKACEKIGRKLRRLLGDDYETFLYADRD